VIATKKSQATTPWACRRRKVDHRRSPLGLPFGRHGQHFLTVLGETRIPSFRRSSLAMHSSPHKGFSFAIRRIRTWICWNRRSAGLRPQPPEQFPSRSMPTDHRFRTHHYQDILPVEGQPQQSILFSPNYLVQFSMLRFWTRPNSSELLVTSVSSRERACAAWSASAQPSMLRSITESRSARNWRASTLGACASASAITPRGTNRRGRIGHNSATGVPLRVNTKVRPVSTSRRTDAD
jgi:hypothetical protein